MALEGLAADIDKVVADLVANGVTDDELARAKRRLIANAIYAQDSHAALARVFGEALVLGETMDDVRAWPAAIEAVTADEVVAAAKKYLDIRRSVTGYLVGAPADTRS